MIKDRFKFRAWNKKERIMHYKAEQTYDTLTGSPRIWKQSFSDVLDDENYIVEQCTGIKDANGKLVFEGDILDVLFENFDGKIFHMRDLLCVVVYFNGSFMFRDKEGFSRYFDETAFAILNKELFAAEVIGNIHENPELLK